MGPPWDPASDRRGTHSRGASALRLVWVYPDLLSTYGDRGNLLILERRARLRGIGVESILVNSDQQVPSQGDIYLLGGGEDLPQVLAARRLRQDGGLMAAARRGSVIFAVCAGYELIGHEFGGVEGEPVAGLEILDIRSGRGERRGVGEILADVDPALGLPKLTGFENHQGVTQVGPHAKPLARVSVGTATGTAPRAPTRAGCWAPTCTAPRWCATRPWPTCCSAGPSGRCPGGPGRGGVDHPVPRPAPGGRARLSPGSAPAAQHRRLGRRAPGPRRRTPRPRT